MTVAVFLSFIKAQHVFAYIISGLSVLLHWLFVFAWANILASWLFFYRKSGNLILHILQICFLFSTALSILGAL